jgi:hypothetical protein
VRQLAQIAPAERPSASKVRQDIVHRGEAIDGLLRVQWSQLDIVREQVCPGPLQSLLDCGFREFKRCRNFCGVYANTALSTKASASSGLMRG